MIFLRLLPVFLSFLLIAAHFHRADAPLIALFCLLAPALLFFPRPWSVRLVQALLVLAAAEWIRTLFFLVQIRQEMDQPWTRLAIILGVVAILTAASALLFRVRSVRIRYNV